MTSVVLVHGWDPNNKGQPFWNEVYGQLKASIVAAGHDFHGPLLPRNGNTAGDSAINAEFLSNYIDYYKLEDPILIGHSIGGVAIEFFMRKINAGRVPKYAILDCNLIGPGATYLSCWFGPPDQCKGSSIRNQIFSSAIPPEEFLYIWATYDGVYLTPDRKIKVSGDHKSMVSNPLTLEAIDAFIR